MPATPMSYFDQSQYAFAAYAEGLVEGSTPSAIATNITLLRAADMSLSQATAFLTRNQIVAHMPNDSANGFSASLFYDSVLNRYVLAMRGTEALSVDSAADATIISSGFEELQTIAMVNWIRRLTATAETLVPQYRRVPGGFEIASYVSGLDRIPAGTSITVSGHSLGGYLSLMATTFFPTLISDVYVQSTRIPRLTGSASLRWKSRRHWHLSAGQNVQSHRGRRTGRRDGHRRFPRRDGPNLFGVEYFPVSQSQYRDVNRLCRVVCVVRLGQ